MNNPNAEWNTFVSQLPKGVILVFRVGPWVTLAAAIMMAGLGLVELFWKGLGSAWNQLALATVGAVAAVLSLVFTRKYYPRASRRNAADDRRDPPEEGPTP